MTYELISKIESELKTELDTNQMAKLHEVLLHCIVGSVLDSDSNVPDTELIPLFLSSKSIEGCSQRTIRYYDYVLKSVFNIVNKPIKTISTNDLRDYLSNYQSEHNVTKCTIDNIRRVLSSFFTWLEEEDIIFKSPMKRIKKVRTAKHVKEVYTDENLEILRDNCNNLRDLALVDLLCSTGIRVGELVTLDISDMDFANRECVVLGKGDKERLVYFDARTKVHLSNYIQSRIDDNPALFVTLNKPYDRLKISGVESMLRGMSTKIDIGRIHPHKFRRTLATRAIDKGMPVEQVQKLLGHTKIDTTMEYAFVNQNNVKDSHRKFIS